MKANKFFISLMKFSFFSVTFAIALFFVIFAKEKKPDSRFFPKSDILHSSLKIVEKNYFDSSLVRPKKMFEEALKALSREIPPVMVEISDTQDDRLTLTAGSLQKTFDYHDFNNVDDLAKLLQEVLLFVKQNISKDDLENFSEVDYSAINGMLASLDPHSSLLTPQVYQDFTADAQGKYAGVGMVIRASEGKIEVAAMVGDNSPAEIAGVRPGDLIIKIDEKSAIGISVEDAKNRLRGLKDSKVVVEVERKDEKTPLSFNIIRDEIKLSSVKSHKFSFDNGESLGYIFISRVLANTHDELLESLVSLGSDLSDFKGLVLDLRNNPGGLLNRAVDIANTFLNEGVIVSIAGVNKQNIIKYEAKPFGTTKNFPIVVLVNRFSASASEIISSALQKNGRAIVIGEKTFGKGTVQSLVERFKDGSALKLTTSQYLTPGERSIQSLGVIPEIWLAPEIISDDFIKILPTNNLLEKGLDNSLSLSSDEVPEESILKLNYLEEPVKLNSQELADESLSFYNKLNTAKLEKDFWVQTAFNILRNTKSSSYEDLLETAKNHTHQESAIQEEKIIKALNNFKIDWQKTSFNQLPNIKDALKIDLTILKKQKNKFQPSSNPFPSDTEGRIMVSATNKSDKNLSRVIGVISSDNELLDGKQLVFGNLASGKTVKRFVNFKTRAFEVPGISLIDIDFREFDQPIFQSLEHKINFAANKLPDFTSRYEFRGEDNAEVIAKDGSLIKLNVSLTNISDVDSGPVNLSIKNGDLIFISLDKGGVNFSNIAPGQTVEALFNMKLTGIPNDKKYDALILLNAQKYPILNLTQKIVMVYDEPVASFNNSPPKIKFNLDNENLTLSGEVRDDKRVKEMYIFQNQNKIFYSQFKETDESFSFSISPDLVDEYNSFLIVAADDSGVTSQRVLQIAK